MLSLIVGIGLNIIVAELLEIKITGFVISQLAAEVSPTTELAQCVERVGGRATASAFSHPVFALQNMQQVLLLLHGNKSHYPFFDLVLFEKIVVDFEFLVHECIANTVYIISCHRYFLSLVGIGQTMRRFYRMLFLPHPVSIEFPDRHERQI